MKRLAALLFFATLLGASPISEARAQQEEIITRYDGGSSTRPGTCRAFLEYEMQYDRDGIANWRNQPAAGTIMDPPPRLETAGIQETSPGMLRYESLLILSFKRASAPASKPTERRERRSFTCNNATGHIRIQNVNSRILGD